MWPSVDTRALKSRHRRVEGVRGSIRSYPKGRVIAELMDALNAFRKRPSVFERLPLKPRPA